MTVQEKLKLPQVKLDVGSGNHNLKQPLDEWVRIDGCEGDKVDIICDFGEIPLPSGVADILWNGDVIEHIPMWEHDRVLGEWNRLLKIGGEIAGQTPNLHRIMVDYTSGKLSLEDATNGLYGWHDSVWQQHYLTFTTETLTKLLEKYGFGDVAFYGSPGSNDPHTAWWLCFQAKKIKNL